MPPKKSQWHFTRAAYLLGKDCSLPEREAHRIVYYGHEFVRALIDSWHYRQFNKKFREHHQSKGK